LLDRTQVTAGRALREFVEDRGHRSAAQIAFFAILSAVPLGILLVGALGLVADDAEVRSRIVTTVFDNVPLSTDADRDRLEGTVVSALENAGRLRVVPVLLVIAAATGVMGALRHAINEAWDIEERPPLLQRKALDVALVLGVSVVAALALSVAATRKASEVVEDESSVAGALLDGLTELLPFVFTLLTILFVYRVLPMRRQPVREIWPGALVATVLLTLVRGTLELYFEEFADLGAIYGSLGALMALLVFVYAASMALVLGAEFASEYSRLPSDAEVERVATSQRRAALSRLPFR